MKKTKFVADYCGDIVVIGFTGAHEEIRKYLKKTFGIQNSGKRNINLIEKKFDVEVAPHVIAHVEPFSWVVRKDVIKRDKLKEVKE